MRVREIDTSVRRDVRRFVDFPFKLYAACRQWSPPLVANVKFALNRKRHPFYHGSDAAFYLAEEDGDVIGRIAVLDNRRYNAYTGRNAAFFYYFDVVNNTAAAHGLFDAAADWAAGRGLETLLGPKGLLRSDPLGILVEGYEHVAALSMPYNYPYYSKLMKAVGLEKDMDYRSGYMVSGQALPERMYRLADRVKERRGFWVKSFRSKRELRAWIPKIQKVNNEAFTDVWGYYPVGDAEIRMIGEQMLALADPRLIKLVMQEDRIAGFALIFPDITRALRATRGRLWPLGWIRILWAIYKTDRLCGNGVGLLPRYQGLGASMLLYLELDRAVRARGATRCEIAQVMETNIKSLNDMNTVGVTWYKRHRLYHKPI
jgi:GNAT superfamily N-acetyltransferase